jgi:carbon monoxide dehydrogenase subunit G
MSGRRQRLPGCPALCYIGGRGSPQAGNLRVIVHVALKRLQEDTLVVWQAAMDAEIKSGTWQAAWMKSHLQN